MICYDNGCNWFDFRWIIRKSLLWLSKTLWIRYSCRVSSETTNSWHSGTSSTSTSTQSTSIMKNYTNMSSRSASIQARPPLPSRKDSCLSRREMKREGSIEGEEKSLQGVLTPVKHSGERGPEWISWSRTWMTLETKTLAVLVVWDLFKTLPRRFCQALRRCARCSSRITRGLKICWEEEAITWAHPPNTDDRGYQYPIDFNSNAYLLFTT